MADLWLSVWVLGAFGWLAVIMLAFLKTPAVDMAVRTLEDLGWSRVQALALILIAYSVLWPITVTAALVTILWERR